MKNNNKFKPTRYTNKHNRQYNASSMKHRVTQFTSSESLSEAEETLRAFRVGGGMERIADLAESEYRSLRWNPDDTTATEDEEPVIFYDLDDFDDTYPEAVPA